MSHPAARIAALATLACALVIATGTGSAAPSAPFVGPPAPPIVRYEDGRATVIATREPLSALLARLGEASGFEVRGTLPADRDVAVHMQDVPLHQAVERLVGDCNFTLRFAADGTPLRLTLRGAPVARVPPRAAAARPAPSSAFLQLWAQHPPVRIGGTLATALNRQHVRLPQLALALRLQNDPAVRRQAMQHLLAAIEKDPPLRAALRGMTAPQLAHFARTYARARAGELTRFLAGRARDPAVRTRAKAALASLR